jgi:hypothetical protein
MVRAQHFDLRADLTVILLTGLPVFSVYSDIFCYKFATLNYRQSGRNPLEKLSALWLDMLNRG